MIKELSLTVIAVSALFFAGCGGGSTSTPSITAIVQIDNTSTYDINELYIKKSSSLSWGRDLISAGKVIQSNTKVNFETALCDTLIDIKIEYDFSLDFGIKEQVKLDCGETVSIKFL